MEITRELAIKILRHLDQHKDFYFPFLVVNKEYAEKDDDFMDIEPSEWRTIQDDEKYQTFQLWENLQHLDEKTARLMAKGFIEEITDVSLEKAISGLAKECRRYFKEDMWLTHKTIDYGENEFIGGKAEAFVECLDLIKEFRN